MEHLTRFEPALPISALVESPHNPRKQFNEHKLGELTESVRDKGIITPLLVRPLPGAAEGIYEIAAGHRRYRAASRAGLPAVPVMIRDLSEAEFLEILTIENLQREDIHELEEGQGYHDLIARTGYTVGLIAAKLSKSLSYMQQRLKLLDLSPELKTEFSGGHFTFSHALQLARLTPEAQAQIHGDLYDKDGQVISVADLRRQIAGKIYLDLLKAPWDVHDTQMLPAAGSCTACHKRTGFHPTLFPDLDAREDYCQDRKCWQEKGKALVQIRLRTVEAQSGRPALMISCRYEHNAQRRREGVLYSGEWKPRGEQVCKHLKAAVCVETDPWSRDGLTLGEHVYVCADAKCEIHWGRNSLLRPPFKSLTVEEQLEEIREEKDREINREVKEKTISQFYESIAWPVSLPLVKDLLFSSFEHNNVDGAIKFLGLQLPAKIAADKNYNTREPKAVEWLKSEIGPGGASLVAKLLVRELMMTLAFDGELAIATKHIGEEDAAAVRRLVEDEVGQRYAEREAAVLNPPKPAAKKAATKKAGKK
jgi:ParB/RepB/Spo0J family partition protein